MQYSIIHQPPQEETSKEKLQARDDLLKYIETFLKKFNRISFREMPKVLIQAWNKFSEVKHAQPEEVQELLNKLLQDVQNISEELADFINTPNWNRPIVYYDDDDDEDYTIAITPVLPTEEPVNSLSMGDEHLDTILATESDEVIKSSVEDLVPIPSESEGIPESDDDSFSIDNIEYVEASPPDSEIVSLEVVEIIISKVGGIDDDILLTNLMKISFISSGSTITRSDYSLSDYEAFYDHIKEKSSGSTTTHSEFSLSKYDSFIFDLSINPFPPANRSDFYHEEFAGELAHIISPPEYDRFYFKNEPESGDFTMDVVGDIFPTR
ncbi:hypothetical protein Tco_1501568 [Tanacetum coccineum]